MSIETAYTLCFLSDIMSAGLRALCQVGLKAADQLGMSTMTAHNFGGTNFNIFFLKPFEDFSIFFEVENLNPKK